MEAVPDFEVIRYKPYVIVDNTAALEKQIGKLYAESLSQAFRLWQEYVKINSLPTKVSWYVKPFYN